MAYQQPPYPPPPYEQPPYPQQPYPPPPYPQQPPYQQPYQQPPYPPPPYPYGPPPKQKGRGCLGVGLGCLVAALIFLVVGVVVIGVTVVVVRNKVKENYFPDVHAPLTNGATGTVKTAGQSSQKVTVVSIMDNAKSTNPLLAPKPGNRYIAVQVIIENVGNSEISPGTWTLHTTTDLDFGTASARGIGQDVPSAGLLPGAKTQGTIVFEIPANARVKSVRYVPTEFATGSLTFDAP